MKEQEEKKELKELKLIKLSANCMKYLRGGTRGGFAIGGLDCGSNPPPLYSCSSCPALSCPSHR